jgi:hypothetical protein
VRNKITKQLLFIVPIFILGCSSGNKSSDSNGGSIVPLANTGIAGQVYVKAKAEFDLSSAPDGSAQLNLVKKSYAAQNCLHGQCTDFSDITVSNSGSTQFALTNDNSIIQGTENQNISILGNLTIGTLFDNNLTSCDGQKCTAAAIRIYTTDNGGQILGAGLWSQAIGKSVDLTVSGGSSNSMLAPIPYNPTDGSSLQIDLEALAAGKNVIELSGDFLDAGPSAQGYTLSANFTQAGAGTYLAHVVVEYDLIGPTSSGSSGGSNISSIEETSPSRAESVRLVNNIAAFDTQLPNNSDQLGILNTTTNTTNVLTLFGGYNPFDCQCETNPPDIDCQFWDGIPGDLGDPSVYNCNPTYIEISQLPGYSGTYPVDFGSCQVACNGGLDDGLGDTPQATGGYYNGANVQNIQQAENHIVFSAMISLDGSNNGTNETLSYNTQAPGQVNSQNPAVNPCSVGGTNPCYLDQLPFTEIGSQTITTANALYFAQNNQLWKTDGTLAGTIQVTSFTGSAPMIDGNFIWDSAANALYLGVDPDGSGTGVTNLIKIILNLPINSNGGDCTTNSNPCQVTVVPNPSTGTGFNPMYPYPINGRIVFGDSGLGTINMSDGVSSSLTQISTPQSSGQSIASMFQGSFYVGGGNSSRIIPGETANIYYGVGNYFLPSHGLYTASLLKFDFSKDWSSPGLCNTSANPCVVSSSDGSVVVNFLSDGPIVLNGSTYVELSNGSQYVVTNGILGSTPSPIILNGNSYTIKMESATLKMANHLYFLATKLSDHSVAVISEDNSGNYQDLLDFQPGQSIFSSFVSSSSMYVYGMAVGDTVAKTYIIQGN